jgi:hypothetical protein
MINLGGLYYFQGDFELAESLLLEAANTGSAIWGESDARIVSVNNKLNKMHNGSASVTVPLSPALQSSYVQDTVMGTVDRRLSLPSLSESGHEDEKSYLESINKSGSNIANETEEALASESEGHFLISRKYIF